MEMWGVSLTWGQACLWYLAVVVIFMGLGGAKSLVGLGGNDPSRHHDSE